MEKIMVEFSAPNIYSYLTHNNDESNTVEGTKRCHRPEI